MQANNRVTKNTRLDLKTIKVVERERTKMRKKAATPKASFSDALNALILNT